MPVSKILIVGALTVVGVGAAVAFSGRNRQQTPEVTEKSSPTTTSTPESEGSTVAKKSTSTPTVKWSYNGSSWQPSSSAPVCEEPLNLASPTDVSKATAILYPGQVRGGNYKAHGGFRFDNATSTALDVSLSLDASLYRGSRYIENGTVQYMLDFISPCGYFLRYDHLLTLTEDFSRLVEAQLPEAKENASATTPFSTSPNFKQGALIATAVGFEKPKLNVSFDYGVYDLRKVNAASETTSFQKNAASSSKELSYFGVCWLNMLPNADATIVKNLPGSGTEGTASDYCK
jgi:hypothetical protein